MSQTRVATTTLTERLSGYFWTAVEVVALFVTTLINPESEDGGMLCFFGLVGSDSPAIS